MRGWVGRVGVRGEGRDEGMGRIYTYICVVPVSHKEWTVF